MPKIYRKILDLRNMYLIQKSGYFDKCYYKREYSDVKGNLLKHYYYEGYKLGNNPSEKFSNNYYLDHNADIKNCGINPLLHYVVSGKNEGREIRKYFGMSIRDLYYHLYKRDYCCDVYLKGIDKKRITLILGNTLDKDCLKLVLNTIELCEKDNMFLRIIYQDFEIEKLFLWLKEKGKEKFSNLSFLKWNSKYLLEVSFDEKFICNDFLMLYTLINTKMITKPIYYYVTGCCNLNEEEQMMLSFWYQNKKIICIGNSEICQYQLKIESNLRKSKKNSYRLCFDFFDMSVFIFQMYNDFFLNHCFRSNFQFYYKSEKMQKSICFDNAVSVCSVSEITDMDVVVQFAYQKDSFLKGDSAIHVYFEKVNDRIEFIDLEDILFESDEFEINTFDTMMKQTLKKIGIGDVDV